MPDINTLRTPPAGVSLFRDPSFRPRLDAVYAASTALPEFPPPGEQLANLRLHWKNCGPLISAGLWAVEPLARTLRMAIDYYAAQHAYSHALAVECFVALHSDPYQYPAPFKQYRLKPLLMIARTLTNVMQPSEHDGSEDIQPRVMVALRAIDEASLYQAALLMVLRYGEAGHSAEWELLAMARGMLEDVEAFQGRTNESSLLRQWAQNPAHPGRRLVLSGTGSSGPWLGSQISLPRSSRPTWGLR